MDEMQILDLPTADAWVSTAADAIAAAIVRSIDQDGGAVVGLSGGSTPRPVYAALAGRKDIAWSRVTFFLLDERYVPPTHTDSNQRMIKETLMQGPASAAAFLAPDTALPFDDCVAAYGTSVQGILERSPPSVVILGLGPDGHVASLFPPLPRSAHGPATVIRTETDRFAVRDRISVTLPVMQRARERFLLLTGAEKRSLLQELLRSPPDIERWPAQGLFDGRSAWFVGP